ncbi:MAG: hypothetical protein JXA98_07180, partial [Methanosarcinaceae archaeon]|nr:hypothetical protein [Methanosarcinaceae archaeon]
MWNKQVNGMGNVMGKMKVCSLVLLLILVLVPVVSAEEPKTKITYISWSESDILEEASQTNDYSDFIEYAFINYLEYPDTSDELITAAESGFLETQDVILCQGVYGAPFTDNVIVNDSLKAAHDRGTALYSIYPMDPGYTPPSYFDYHSDGTTDDPVASYYRNMINDTLDDS